MSEWRNIEARLDIGVEEAFEEIMLLWNDKMNGDVDGAWSRFVAECKARYEEGRRQHAGTNTTWDAWSDEDFEKNIREELIDLVIYSAARCMRKARKS